MSELAPWEDVESASNGHKVSARREPLSEPEVHQMLVRDLASGLDKHADLARQYGVHQSSILRFAVRYQKEIDVARQRMETSLDSLWIAQKELRIAAMQRDYEQSLASEFASHFKQISARQQIADSVSEQLGQTPPRATMVVVPAEHVLLVQCPTCGGTWAGDIDSLLT